MGPSQSKDNSDVADTQVDVKPTIESKEDSCEATVQIVACDLISGEALAAKDDVPHTEEPVAIAGMPVTELENADSSDLPLIIGGPSGVGKGTLVGMLFSEFPDLFSKKVSHTTRDPRTGEVNGVSYHFISHEQFKADEAAGKFIESTETHGRCYGTQYSAVKQLLNKGKIVILEADVVGVQIISKRNADVKEGKCDAALGLEFHSIWFSPPDYDLLLSRLVGRGSESEEQIQLRLETAKKERIAVEEDPSLFHHTIVNDELQSCYLELKNLLATLYPSFAHLLFPQTEEEKA